MNRLIPCFAKALFLSGYLTALVVSAQTPDSATKIAFAVLPLSKELRDSATVIDVAQDGKIDTLRRGTGAMVCAYRPPTVPQASKTGEKILTIACGPEAVSRVTIRFNAIRRELTAAGKPADAKAVNAVLDAEIKSGQLKTATGATVSFLMSGPVSGFDPKSGTVSPAIRVWQTVNIPYATGASLSLPEKQSDGRPWVMNSGTAGAHIMIDPKPMGAMQ